MKTLLRALAISLPVILFSACSDKVTDDDNSNSNNNNNNNNPTQVANNTVVVDGVEYALSKYVFKEVVDGTGDNHYELVGRAVLTSNQPSVALRFGALPTANTTWHFQDSSNNPALLESDEFWTQVGDDASTWYPEFTSTAFAQTGDLVVEVNGSVMTLSYENIELADNYLTPNVTTRVSVSAKISVDMSDFTGADLVAGIDGDLVD